MVRNSTIESMKHDHTNVWYREFDLNSTPVLVTDVTYLGMTPLISFRLAF